MYPATGILHLGGVRAGPSIRYFLLTANAFIVLLPVGAVVFLRLWDKHLVRVTEERLIAESIVLASAWREVIGNGKSPDTPLYDAAPAAHLVEGYETLPPPARPRPLPAHDPSPLQARGIDFLPVLRASAIANDSDALLLGPDGCAIASSRGDPPGCFGDRPEVAEAMAGTYDAVVRDRGEVEDRDDTRRPRGRVRVYTALPIDLDGRVASIVYMSRPSSSPLEAVWTLRHTIAVALIGCLAIMITVSLFLSWAISRPVWAITNAADAVARGEPPESFRSTGLIPAEVQVLAAALERMTDQLHQRARYVAEFANNVSHELKTPLSSIRGAVELMRDEWEHMDEAQRQRFLANIAADVDRTQRLVQRLLQLARIEQSADEVESIDVRSFVSHMAERYGDRVQVRFGSAPGRIAMNGDHLETALTNLVDNAVRHGAGQPIEILVGSGESGRLQVKVRDHGPGISEGNRRRVFERFFTTERDRGGTGLGLAIVKAIAESRGGNVRFDTGRDGTTFTLEL